MADYVVRDTQLASVADAIRAKGGTSAPLSFPDGFVGAVQAFPDAVTLDALSVSENGVYTAPSGSAYSLVTVNVSGGGGDDHEAEDGIISRTISGSYTNGRVTKIGAYVFRDCESLTSVNFPACTSIGSSAFVHCIRLTTAIFPSCTIIGYNAFTACSSLTTISFPACTSISDSAFAGCSKLTTVSFPACTTINGGAFSSCVSLATISFPVCTSIGSSAFASCSKLTIANFPSCKSIYGYAFYACSSLATVSFPKCTTITGYSIFRTCTRLLSAYFLGSNVPTLGNSSIFAVTPIAGYTDATGGVLGSIFVRASMLSAFKSATNWVYFSSRMVGLTDAEIAALEG